MTWSYKVGDTVRDIYTKRKGKIISVDEYYDNGDGTKSDTLITDGRNYLICYPPTTEQEWVDQGDQDERVPRGAGRDGEPGGAGADPGAAGAKRSASDDLPGATAGLQGGASHLLFSWLVALCDVLTQYSTQGFTNPGVNFVKHTFHQRTP